MLVVTFGLGVIAGVGVIIGLLRLTATTNPAGCVLALGSLVFLIFWLALVIPWFILAG